MKANLSNLVGVASTLISVAVARVGYADELVPPLVDPGATESLKHTGPKPRIDPGELREWIRLGLRDPDSMRDFAIIGTLREVHCTNMRGSEIVMAWEQVVAFNARNAFGGYVGRQPYGVYFVKGRPVTLGEVDSPTCAGLLYGPH